MLCTVPCERFMLHPTRQRRLYTYLVFHDIVKNRVADPNPDQHGWIRINYFSENTYSDAGVKTALFIFKRDIF
jgi:hypothetical protein